MDGSDEAEVLAEAQRVAAVAAVRRQAAALAAPAGVARCLSCGDALPEGRLAAVPGATLCVACQTAIERGMGR